jgi:hypothetical protein
MFPVPFTQVARSEALAVDAACLTGVEDLLTLGDFNEPVPWQTWQMSVGHVQVEHGFLQVVLLRMLLHLVCACMC